MIDCQAVHNRMNRKKANEARVEGEREREKLEMLVAEMREQLTLNATSLQQQTMTVRELTHELVAAKAQVSNLSVALNEKEKEVKSIRAELHAANANAAKALEWKKELAATKERCERAELDLTKLKGEPDAVPKLIEERDKLLARSTKLEAEAKDRNSELARLRAQVDAVRSQADAAYLHSTQFQQIGGGAGGGAGYGDVMSHAGAAGGGGYFGGGGQGMAAASYGGARGGGAGLNLSMDALRREIEDEERRTVEEQKRWRQRQNKSTA